MFNEKCRKYLVMLFLFLIGNSSFGQDTKCDLYKLLHHDEENRISYFDNGIVRVFLKSDNVFELELLDSSVHFNPKSKEILVRPAGASAFTIKIDEGNILLMDAKDTFNVNQGLDSLSNIKTTGELNPSLKTGKGSFLDVSYVEGKASMIQVQESKKKIGLSVSYLGDKLWLRSIRISWPDSGNYLMISYNQNNPYFFDYFDASRNGGVGVFFEWNKNYVSTASVYISSKGAIESELPGSKPNSGSTDKIYSVKYAKTGVAKNKSKKKFGCK